MAESPSRKSRSHQQPRCDAIFDSLSKYLVKYFPETLIIITRGKAILQRQSNQNICLIAFISK